MAVRRRGRSGILSGAAFCVNTFAIQTQYIFHGNDWMLRKE